MNLMRSERKRRGWSQEDLARIAKMCRVDVSRIESGRMLPYPQQAERLARALGIPEEQLLDEMPDVRIRHPAQKQLRAG